MMYRITAPHFVAAVEIGEAETVIKAAPILKFMKCWGRSQVEKYCRRKHWQYEISGEVPRSISSNELFGLVR